MHASGYGPSVGTHQDGFLPNEQGARVQPRLQRVDPVRQRGYAQPDPTWVTSLPPAPGERPIDDVGRTIARGLGITYHESIIRHREAGPYPSAFDVVAARPEPVLLVYSPLDRCEVEIVADGLRAAGVPDVFAVDATSPIDWAPKWRVPERPRRYPRAAPIDPSELGTWADEEPEKPPTRLAQLRGQQRLFRDAAQVPDMGGSTLVAEAEAAVAVIEEDSTVLGRALAAARENGHEMGAVKTVRYGQDDRHMVECTRCGAALIVTVNVHDGTRQRNLGIPREGPTADQAPCSHPGRSI